MDWFGRSAVSLSLWVAAVGVTAAETASANVKPLENAQFISWTGHQQQKIVSDGSVLTEYQGRTEANNRPGMQLKVSFSPRFSCSPMIALLVSGDTGVELGSANAASNNESSEFKVVSDKSGLTMDTGEIPVFEDDDLLDLRVDGVNVDFPIIVDSEGGTVLTFNGDARERETLRLQIDIGDVATVAVAEDRKITFSLLGSRKTLKALQASCRQHEPIPFDE